MQQQRPNTAKKIIVKKVQFVQFKKKKLKRTHDYRYNGCSKDNNEIYENLQDHKFENLNEMDQRPERYSLPNSHKKKQSK